jgi:hypothetical protein
MRRGLIGLVSLCGACALAITPIKAAGSLAAATTTSDVSGAGHLLGLHAALGESPAAAVADAVQHVAASRFGVAYVGEILTSNGTKVTLYLTQLDRSAETAITAGIQPGVVNFARAPRSLAYLNKLHQNVTSEQASLQRRGIDIVTWGPNFITGREDVSVYHLTAAKEAALDKRFGAANLTFANTAQDYTAAAVGRDNDTAPWNGGDFDDVVDPALGAFTNDCSTGYGAHKGSQWYLITAGHCAFVGYLAFNGTPNFFSPTGVFTLMGETTTDGSYRKKDGIDAGLIDTSEAGQSSSPAVYTAGSTSSQVADVSGTATSPAGDQVCSDGAFEGEICGLVLQKTKPMPECITELVSKTVRYTVCDIYEAIRPKGKVAAGQGDSGGPVFRFVGSKLYATGIITAQSVTDHFKCKTYQIKGFNTRYCSPVLYYTSITSILSEFKLKLNT